MLAGLEHPQKMARVELKLSCESIFLKSPCVASMAPNRRLQDREIGKKHLEGPDLVLGAEPPLLAVDGRLR